VTQPDDAAEAGQPAEEPVQDPAHRLALLAMVATPLLLAGLVYGVLKALSG
jgi:hypothetical protein